MKKSNLLLLGALVATGAKAQPIPSSSVQIYGLLDGGVTYINNNGGASRVKMDSGTMQPNRLGFRGREDMGGGLTTIFALEMGISLDDGSIQQGGRGFGRQSWVGVATTYGDFTLGRQYDLIWNNPGSHVSNISGSLGGGLTSGPGIAVVDSHQGGARIDNSFKWMGKFGNFTFGALYGLGNQSTPATRIRSFAVGYEDGQRGVRIAYSSDNYIAQPLTLGYTVTGSRVAVLGAYQDFYAWRIYGSLVNAKSESSSDRTRALEAGVTYKITPFTSVGVGASRAAMHDRKNAAGRLRLVTAGIDHVLSKRTDVYLNFANIHSDGAAGNATLGSPAGVTAIASGNSQGAVRVGVRHSF